jgi:O-antigen/teichoic acid export membrane protein
MSSKIDVRDIVRDHVATLVSYRTKQRSLSDVVTFFVLPSLFGAVMLSRGYVLMRESCNVLITTLAVFAGLLFNLLVLVHTLMRRADSRVSPDESALVQQIASNISFATLVALFSLVPLTAQAVRNQEDRIGIVLSAIAFAVIANLCLTLLMILKRVHTLLRNEMVRS